MTIRDDLSNHNRFDPNYQHGDNLIPKIISFFIALIISLAMWIFVLLLIFFPLYGICKEIYDWKTGQRQSTIPLVGTTTLNVGDLATEISTGRQVLVVGKKIGKRGWDKKIYYCSYIDEDNNLVLREFKINEIY
ncbi:MAG: hypothetical protein ACOCV1_06610 [Bacillota bacterium]